MSVAVDPSDYSEGEDRYIRFTEEVLNVRLSATQKRIIRAVTNNPRTLIISGNGVGKSYAVACLIIAFTMTNLDSTVLGTSGSYSQFRDTMWRPLRKVYKRAKRNVRMPGQLRRGNPPRLEIDEDWYAKAVSPRDPGDLEGRHDDTVLVVIEEADKRYITDEHFDSAGSSVTDLNDRVVAIANPPDDETNIVYRKKQADRWHTVQFSSFESHNVLVDTGIIDDEPIPGLVDLITLASDFEAWIGESWPRVSESYPGKWPGMHEIETRLESGEIERETVIEWLRPGFPQAKAIHEERSDLDERWYKRRAGVIPPAGAEVHRPIYLDDVRQAVRDAINFGTDRFGIGVDIGRTGDSTAIVEVRNVEGSDGKALYLRTDEDRERTHGDNESMIRRAMNDGAMLGTAAGDATGEGSGVADQMVAEYENFVRFDSGMKPVGRDKRDYKDRRTQALAMLGEFLRNGGVFEDRRLEKELFAAVRVVQYNRRRSGGRNVFKATSKDKIKKQIGRSPDVLDAAAIAVWASNDAHVEQIRQVSANERKTISSTW